MSDQVTKIGHSTIQYGTFNNRIYLMKLAREDYPAIITRLEELARQHGFSKIFAKIPDWAAQGFLEAGYSCEATIPNFYNGKTNASFMAFYLDPERRQLSAPEQQKLKKVLQAARSKAADPSTPPSLPSEYGFRIAEPDHASLVAQLYQQVFETYPFPIQDPDYILKTMKENVVYFGIWKDEQLVAVSSSEMDVDAQNVEMTDFATLPTYRGAGLATSLLYQMHEEMKKRGMLTAYTIARAGSFGMNITFARMGYKFGGTLINNTNIGGTIESMNVWYRPL